MLLISLLSGLLAWALPLWLCCRCDRPAVRRQALWFISRSCAACGLSLLSVLLDALRRISIRDFGALEDYFYAEVHAAVVLVAVTILLNALATLLLCRPAKGGTQ